MQTFGLMIFIAVGMATIAGLSFALYRALPALLLDRAARHGRYSNLGARDDLPNNTAGSAGVTDFDALSRRSA